MNITDEEILLSNTLSLDEIGTLHLPTVKEISRIGRDDYFELLTPYLLSDESLEEIDNSITVYDILFAENNILMLQQFLVSIGLFFKLDVELGVLNGDFVIELSNGGLITRQNFTQLQKIIRKSHHIKLKKPDKVPKDMSEEQKKVYEKLQKHRSRKAKKDEPTFKEIINTVMHKGESFISYKDVADFTYYQLMNSYYVIVGISVYEENMGYQLSEKYEVKDKFPHWSETIKDI